jgi:acyl carrier protein
MDKKNVLSLIYESIDDYNTVVEKEIRIKKTEDTLLFDPMGKLDSVGYITMSVAIEQKIEKELGITIALFEGNPDYPVENPLKSVSSTVDYLLWLIEHKKITK